MDVPASGGVHVKIQFYLRDCSSVGNKKTNNYAVDQVGKEYVLIEKEIKSSFDVNTKRGPARINV